MIPAPIAMPLRFRLSQRRVADIMVMEWMMHLYLGCRVIVGQDMAAGSVARIGKGTEAEEGSRPSGQDGVLGLLITIHASHARLEMEMWLVPRLQLMVPDENSTTRNGWGEPMTCPMYSLRRTPGE